MGSHLPKTTEQGSGTAGSEPGGVAFPSFPLCKINGKDAAGV